MKRVLTAALLVAALASCQSKSGKKLEETKSNTTKKVRAHRTYISQYDYQRKFFDDVTILTVDTMIHKDDIVKMNGLEFKVID